MHLPTNRNRHRIAAFPHLEAADAPPILIDGLTPDSSGGRLPMKRVTDETFRVEADVHAPPDCVAVALKWRLRGDIEWEMMAMLPSPGDPVRYCAEMAFIEPGIYDYAIGVRFRSAASLFHDTPPETLIVERPLARGAAWAKLQLSAIPGRALSGCTAQLDALAMAGFDIVSLPDISAKSDPTRVDPLLGNLDDFDQLRRLAKQRRLEIALTPSLPMDGFYQSGWRSQLDTACSILRAWAGRGVRIFRIETAAPPGFWQFVLLTMREEYPDLIFSGNPQDSSWKNWIALAKAGFSDISLPLRTTEKTALKKSIFELNRTEFRDHFRANLWPEIDGDSEAQIRIALAAAISPVWGISSDLIRDTTSSLASFVTRLNEIRRTHTALREHSPAIVCHCRQPQVLCLLKGQPQDHQILIVILLDPHTAEKTEAVIQFPRANKWDRFILHDLFSGRDQQWSGSEHSITLDSEIHPVRIFRIEK